MSSIFPFAWRNFHCFCSWNWSYISLGICSSCWNWTSDTDFRICKSIVNQFDLIFEFDLIFAFDLDLPLLLRKRMLSIRQLLVILCFTWICPYNWWSCHLCFLWNSRQLFNYSWLLARYHWIGFAFLHTSNEKKNWWWLSRERYWHRNILWTYCWRSFSLSKISKPLI